MNATKAHDNLETEPCPCCKTSRETYTMIRVNTITDSFGWPVSVWQCQNCGHQQEFSELPEAG